jgi:hypothetical protein
LRELPVDPNDDRSHKQLELAVCTKPEKPRQCTALKQAIKHQIARHTGQRIQKLEVDVSDDRVVVRGCVLSYYLKQLALQGVLDVLGSAAAMAIELNVEVGGRSPTPDPRH